MVLLQKNAGAQEIFVKFQVFWWLNQLGTSHGDLCHPVFFRLFQSLTHGQFWTSSNFGTHLDGTSLQLFQAVFIEVLQNFPTKKIFIPQKNGWFSRKIVDSPSKNGWFSGFSPNFCTCSYLVYLWVKFDSIKASTVLRFGDPPGRWGVQFHGVCSQPDLWGFGCSYLICKDLVDWLDFWFLLGFWGWFLWIYDRY